MKKRAPGAVGRRLMDCVLPRPEHGPLLGTLATTYEMDPEFFETDLLPSLLGLGGWDDRNWTSRIAMERQLAEMESATLLLDASRYRGRPRSLRVEIIPVRLKPGTVLHAKVLLIVHEDAVRLLVGSANLTEPGYRRNREVVAVWTATAGEQAHVPLIHEALTGFKVTLGAWLTSGAAGLIEKALARLETWAVGFRDETTGFCWGGGLVPLWELFLARWPLDEPINRITIVSPFWSEEDDQGPLSTVLTRLQRQGLLAPGAELRLLTEALPDPAVGYRPVLPASFETFDPSSLGVQATAQAVQPGVSPDEIDGEPVTTLRPLHAKLVLVEGRQTSLAYLGSANFSRHGWGILSDPARANVEAGVVLRRTGPGRKAVVGLVPAVAGEPVALTGAAGGRLAKPEIAPPGPPWPTFLREVILAPAQDDPSRLDLAVVIVPALVEGDWALRLIPSEAGAVPPLVDGQAGASRPSDPDQIRLTPDALRRLLIDQEVLVTWWACAEGIRFPVNVAAQARHELPIAPGGHKPGEALLLAYYQGRIRWEDLFPDPDPSESARGGQVLPAEDQGVDTSLIQAYQLRAFVEALRGIRDDLRAAARGTGPTMRLATLGPVSPVALARSVLEAVRQGQRTPVAAGFQLVEILTCLHDAREFVNGEEAAPVWLQTIDAAKVEVEKLLLGLEQAHWESLSGTFQQYKNAILGNQRQGQRG